MTFQVFDPEKLSETTKTHHRQSARMRARRRAQRQAAGGEVAAVEPVRRLTMVDILPIRRAVTTTTADVDLDALADKIALRMESRQADHRISSPVVKSSEPLYLADLLKACFSCHASHRTAASWSGYRTLVTKWTAFWEGNGPDLKSLTGEDLQQFFEGVLVWQSERSWRKNCDLLFKLLKTACPLTISNREGRKSDAPLSIDTLPVWELPRDRWFRDRQTTQATTQAIDGNQPAETTGKTSRNECGHRRRNLPLLTIGEFGSVLTACKGATFMDPIWWECFFCHVWFNGPRWADMWRFRWNDPLALLAIDMKHQTFRFTETKAGGDGQVPIPSWLYGRLSLLMLAQPKSASVYVAAKGTESQYAISTSDTANRERRWKPEYEAIWARAGVTLRKPHELRGVSISYWFKHAPKYRFAATGHSPPAGDVQLRNYVTLDEEFRAAAESFPFPRNHKLS